MFLSLLDEAISKWPMRKKLKLFVCDAWAFLGFFPSRSCLGYLAVNGVIVNSEFY
jgi:hypothetical protein